MSKEDGGPAFPYSVADGHQTLDGSGMSLRDYFATQAMLGEVITCCSDATPIAAQCLVEAAEKAGRTPEAQIAFNAYKMADAMIAERQRG